MNGISLSDCAVLWEWVDLLTWQAAGVGMFVGIVFGGIGGAILHPTIDRAAVRLGEWLSTR